MWDGVLRIGFGGYGSCIALWGLVYIKGEGGLAKMVLASFWCFKFAEIVLT